MYTPGVSQESYASGQTLYTNVDALGSVHDTQTNGSGGPPDVRRYDAFGGAVVAQGSDTLNMGWAASSSYQTDSDTGLMLLGNRYYDLSTGRFLSPDKAKAGDNWYAYCDNNPLTKTDPTGLVTQPNPADIYGTSSEHLDAVMGSLDGWNQGSIQDIMSGQLAINQQIYDAQKAASTDGPFTFGMAGPIADWVSLMSSNKTVSWVAGGVSAYFGAAALNDGASSILESAAGWSNFSGMGTGVLVDGAGTLGAFGLTAGAAIAADAYVFWKIGTAVANAPTKDGTVADSLADKMFTPNGIGTFLQKNMPFGH